MDIESDVEVLPVNNLFTSLIYLYIYLFIYLLPV